MLSCNPRLKLCNCLIFSQLAFGIKGCSSKTRFIPSIFRLLCIALWHYVCEHIIYTVYSDCVLVFAFAFLSWKKKKKKKKKICFKTGLSPLNHTETGENLNQAKILKKENNGLSFYWLENSRTPPPPNPPPPPPYPDPHTEASGTNLTLS